MPEISLPDIKLPDVHFRDGKLPDLRLPDIDLRDRLPEVNLSNLSLPSALRDVSVPEVGLPDVHLPEMRMPEVRMPDVHLPEIRMPEIPMPDVRMPDVRALMPFRRAAPKPASRLPWVLLVAISSVFACWWLLTSSWTGPAVRDAGRRIRSRMDDWRSARAEWGEDAEEHVDGFGASGSTDRPVGEWGEIRAHDSDRWDESPAVAVGPGRNENNA